MTKRTLQRVIPSQATSDGAGVKLRRSIGQSTQARLDPFLMLDEFGTENPEDYIAGFPAHPHRGFENVTRDGCPGRWFEMAKRFGAGHRGADVQIGRHPD